MKIHEYQAKELMRENNIPVPNGRVVRSQQEAVSVARSLGGVRWMVKGQIHAGGRGNAGGVKIAGSLNDVSGYFLDIFGKKLVTGQTDDDGIEVSSVLIEECCDIVNEYYLAVVFDRTNERVNFIASSEGGTSIEETALNYPEKIIIVGIDVATGFTSFCGRKIAYGIGVPKKMIEEAVSIFEKIYDLYIKYDCTLVEINPMSLGKDENFLALDAKIVFDENAIFRNRDIFDRFFEANDLVENEAREYGFSYVSLSGNIGCMVNGAGLAMATMDIIKLKGGEPANFLDVGGTASEEAVRKAFSILIADKNVNGILINIFGGIMRCDLIANGIIGVLAKSELEVPLVVRLEGTNSVLGRKILEDANFKMVLADDLSDAAEKIVELSKHGDGVKCPS